MAQTGVLEYWNIPYRDTALREATMKLALKTAGDKYTAVIAPSPRVRMGYWNDLAQAGATGYDGSNELTFASGTNKYGFPYSVTLPITVPQSKVFSVFGIADYSPNPSLQAFQITQKDVAFPLFYLAPDLYTNEDHKVILNGTLPPVEQNSAMTITLFGTAATTDNIDILFSLAEQAAQTA